MLSDQIETKSRLLAKLLRQLLAWGTYDSLADLTDALKHQCGRHRIRYTPDDMASAFALVGSNRPLVDNAAPDDAAPVATGRPLTPREESRLYREILARYAAERPVTAAEIPPEIDATLVARLAALGESEALIYFWQIADADRLAALVLFEAVTIARPADWDVAAIRAAFERRGGAWVDCTSCFGCRRGDDLAVHHVIGIHHGGSNFLRNLVPLCPGCHTYMHPWLAGQEPTRRRGFESFADVFRGARA